jgi:NO-binding membrane sensor protein with MHYT domain
MLLGEHFLLSLAYSFELPISYDLLPFLFKLIALAVFLLLHFLAKFEFFD